MPPAADQAQTAASGHGSSRRGANGVILHPGMGKAGSSSIQTWLARNVGRLRELGICLLAAPPDRPYEAIEEIDLRPYESGPANANSVLAALEGRPEHKHGLLDSFFGQLERHAAEHHTTIVTAEAMSAYFWRGDPDFLARLERFGADRPVRVPFYVRPQHTSLEAGWRQWGFRSGLSPASFVRKHAESHHYLQTATIVRERAPSVSFEVRPFRRDLLDRGDPAVDFAGRFLGLDPEHLDRPEEIWANRGLPLEVVNALRLSPEGRFWTSMHDNRKIDRVKEVVGEVQSAPSEGVRRSRAVLHAYAHATFEPANVELIRELGWDTEAFVPPAEGLEGDVGLLDELWRPQASARELEAFFSALDRAVEPREAQPEPPDAGVLHELAAARGALTAVAADLERSRRELERLRAARSWRLSRRIAAARARLARPARRDPDPTVRLSRQLERASGRIADVDQPEAAAGAPEHSASSEA